MAKTQKQATSKPAKTQKHAVEDDGMVDAVAAKEFTSTIFGNVTEGQPLNITKERYKVWLSQGLVEEIE